MRLFAPRFGIGFVAGLLAVAAPQAAWAAESAARPVVREFNLPDKAYPGSTHELALGPDGDVWVTQQTQSALVRITPQGRVRIFRLKPDLGPHGLAFDQHGHMWITLQFVNEIAEVSLQGRIMREYPIPKMGSPGLEAAPHGLAIASDGSVWWTGKYGGVIGRLNPRTGRMQIFKLRDRASQPIYIAQGCGAMYFTELNNSRIGRITNSGKITEYRTPTDPQPGGSRPIAVAIRHCQVWFTEESGHRFGVLDPGTGKITEYPIPRPSDKLASLAFDRDGTLWLEFNGPDGNDAIGRVSVGMKVHLLPIPTRNAVLHRIICEPGGNMWFTEMNADKVGYITAR